MRGYGQLISPKIRRIILNFLLGMSVLLVLLAAANALFFHSEDTFLFGYKPYIVASESMEPVFRKYAIVLIEKGGYDDIGAGDVIAFRAREISGQVALHRVLAVTSGGLVTKGDANRIADAQIVTRDAFVGRRIWHTNLTAAVFLPARTPQNIFLAVAASCAFIVLLIIVTKVAKKRLGREKMKASFIRTKKRERFL